MGRSTGHLGMYAGDLSWQMDPDRPPACSVPPSLPLDEQIALHHRFDVAERKLSEKDLDRLQEAARLCRRCPVAPDCYEYARQPQHRVEGVWGGVYWGSAAAPNLARREPVLIPLLPPKRRRRPAA
jgi:hypothetical protein